MQGIKLTLLEARPADRMPRPGDMWPLPVGEVHASKIRLGAAYRRDWQGKREPLVVKLPDESEVNLDARTRVGTEYTVTGEGDSISVYPMVVGHSGKRWKIDKGYIQDEATALKIAKADE